MGPWDHGRGAARSRAHTFALTEFYECRRQLAKGEEPRRSGRVGVADGGPSGGANLAARCRGAALLTEREPELEVENQGCARNAAALRRTCERDAAAEKRRLVEARTRRPGPLTLC